MKGERSEKEQPKTKTTGTAAAIAKEAIRNLKDGLAQASRDYEAANERIKRGPRRTSGRIG